MPTIHVTDINGQTNEIGFEAGDTLKDVLQDHGYEEITGLCGGSCSCATCHCHVIESPVPLPEVESDEAMLLEFTDNFSPDLSRLSCQIELEDEHAGLKVLIVENG